MTGGAMASRRSRRRLLWTFVVALNVPLFVHLVFPGWVGLTANDPLGEVRLAASPWPTHGGLCVDRTRRAPIGDYLAGKVCAPAGFPYRPVVRETGAGLWAVDPSGSCSSVLGDSGRSFDFAAACGGHDYGYDLLRFFGVGAAERRAVDAMFGAALWDSCGDRSFVTRFNCYGWAATFDWVNRGNTLWRRYEVPQGVIGANNVSDWSGKVVQVAVPADVGLAVWMLRRRRRARVASRDGASVLRRVLLADPS